MLRLFRCNRGATLLELMVVVAIMGILTAIAVPVYGDYTDKAHKAVAAQNASIGYSVAMVMLSVGEGGSSQGAFSAAFEAHLNEPPHYSQAPEEMPPFIDALKTEPGYTLYLAGGGGGDAMDTLLPSDDNPILYMVWYDGSYYGIADIVRGTTRGFRVDELKTTG